MANVSRQLPPYDLPSTRHGTRLISSGVSQPGQTASPGERQRPEPSAVATDTRRPNAGSVAADGPVGSRAPNAPRTPRVARVASSPARELHDRTLASVARQARSSLVDDTAAAAATAPKMAWPRSWVRHGVIVRSIVP